jgi:hypothetical protein
VWFLFRLLLGALCAATGSRQDLIVVCQNSVLIWKSADRVTSDGFPDPHRQPPIK